MALILNALMEIMRMPTIGGVLLELAFLATPLWVAVFVGLVVGWAWRPRWAAGLVGGGKGNSDDEMNVNESKDAFYGLQLAVPRLDWLRAQLPSYVTYLIPEQGSEKKKSDVDLGSPSQENKNLAVTLEDFQNLFALVETTDGGPAWIHMMDKSLPSLSYQAWRRDLEKGPPQYRSRTVFDDAKPETVRDFFWDDEFRMKNKWDDMLLYHETLEECPVTGTMLVHWIRKFPFFCSDREYTIGRRIWEVDGAYYCVTKKILLIVLCSTMSLVCHTPQYLAERNPGEWTFITPAGAFVQARNFYLYLLNIFLKFLILTPLFSVESRRGDGQMTACEVLLFHYEDMGIPWEIAKLGVRQGMWGCVKKIEPGLRAYQAARKSGEPLSPCSMMAQINTKVTSSYLKSLGDYSDQCDDIVEAEKKPWGSNIPKFVLIGGALALACTVDRGLITKAIIFGAVRRFAKIGRRL
ncbi:hypothetical protein MA16_Dca017155 [Dendrobium catenatum]|uniref:START domain-containing protein n=1 Tax=Dendrobium catenatum TaxID=906689 RepID=A0A2I0V860_9ASPA|nr:hypothetical protein MA16_Dca017155 [Dendrobium catenatum]